MSIDPTLRTGATQDEVIASIRDRLIAQLEWCRSGNCFLSDQPTPDVLPAGNIACTVSPGSSSSGPHELAHLVTEAATTIVTPMVKVRLDRPRRADKKLTAPDRGILTLKRDVLRALLADEAWEPHVDGRPLLRDVLWFDRAMHGEVTVGETKMLAVQLHFHTPFDWDLS